MVKKYTDFETQLGESAELTDKAKLSLYKKSQNSGISVDILEEVYRRGYKCWTEIFGGTQDSFAFDRVNSFIAGGFAAQLDEDLMEKRGLWDNIHAKRARIKAGSGEHMRKPGSKGAPTDAALKASQNEDSDPCWDDYKMVGMKKGKRGKPVPDCVLKEKDVELNKPVMTPDQLAKKHGKTISNIKKALNKGTKVEGEHTTDKDEARKIASAHIGERPDYYEKLSKAGLEEGKIKDAAKVAALMGALTAHAGKVYDVGNVAAHNDDPALAAATIASYANPASRALQMLPTALKVDKANKGEDELARQKKYPKKKVEEGKSTQEPHSKNKNKSASRFDASDELVSIYKHDTPGQNMKEDSLETIKKVIRECLDEATYKGRKVSLNKPFRTPGGPKKSAVYVDPDGDGNAKIVRFGDPHLSIKKNQPARKKSYCARSSGQGNLTKKDSANYWSRRAWNCEETVNELSVPAGTTGKRKEVSTPMVSVRMASGKIEKHPPGKSSSSGGGGDEE